MSGYMHVYTGDGKGKTTAAFGLALRAAGAGLQVVIVQLLKGRQSGEALAISRMPGVTVFRNSRDYGFFGSIDERRKREVCEENNAMLRAATTLADEGRCDMLIIDEASVAYNLGAVDKTLIDGLIYDRRPIELVLTGRDAPEHFLKNADYVSDIRKLKHPFDSGVPARRGVEY